MEYNRDSHGGHKDGHKGHYILPTSLILKIGAALMALTVITVVVAHIDLGAANFFIAVLVASIKACLVAIFFMNLRYDSRQNSVIFCTSFVFLAIFIVLTSTDLFFRGDVYTTAAELAPKGNTNVSHIKNAWISTPELIAHGHEVFEQNCVTCHGPEGYGNGISAAGLDPHPRNFHSNDNWKNGRSKAMVFKTLKEGIPPKFNMASYASLPVDDRWALAAFVLSLGPDAPKESTAADFAKVGVDISRPDGGLKGSDEKTIPVDLAMSQMAIAETRAPARPGIILSGSDMSDENAHTGKALYEQSCVQCHGIHGEGARWKAIGVIPIHAYVDTPAFTSQTAGLHSPEAFNHVVMEGVQGDLMPGYGQFNKEDLAALYGYVKSLSK